MHFVTRARKAQNRGDIVRAIFILITGLKREPDDESGIDALIDLVGSHASVTGLEHEIVEIISKRRDSSDVLSVLVDTLRERDEQQAAATILDHGTQFGITYRAPEPETVEEPTLEATKSDSAKDASSLSEHEQTQSPHNHETEVATEELHRVSELHDTPKTAPKNIPADTSLSTPFNAAPLLIGLAVACLFIGAYRFTDTECADCHAFDELVLNWPQSRAKIESLDFQSEEMAERAAFLRSLGDESISIEQPRTLWATAATLISQGQDCPEVEPEHFAMLVCRSRYASQTDPAKARRLNRRIETLAPNFSIDGWADAEPDNYEKERKRAFSLFNASEADVASGKGVYLELFQLLKTWRSGSAFTAADKAKVDALFSTCKREFCALLHASIPRALLYSGNPELAKKYVVDARSGLTSWEAEEAFFTRAEVHMAHRESAQARQILDRVKASGDAVRAEEAWQVYQCWIASKCDGDPSTTRVRELFGWVRSDARLLGDHVATEFGALARAQRGRLLSLPTRGWFAEWHSERIALAAMSAVGSTTSFDERFRKGKTATFDSRFWKGLALFWRGRFEQALLWFDGADPMSVGYRGLALRALGDRTNGNLALEKAGQRFARIHGASFELGRLNLAFGKRDVANTYFEMAWRQNWSDTGALQLWCETRDAVVSSALALAISKPLGKANVDHVFETCDIVRSTRSASKSRAKSFYESIQTSTNPWVLVNAGDFFRKREEWDRAQLLFDRALTLDPISPKALHGAALVYEAKGQNDVAKDFAKRYIELWPSGAQASSLRSRFL